MRWKGMAMPVKRILVADDDVGVLDRLRKLLAREGYAPETVKNGRELLAAIEREEPALVILDITFEERARVKAEPLDGIELLRHIREESQIPVLMLSSTSLGAVKVMALSMGADDYMTKPFDPAELLARVKAILRRTQREGRGETEMVFGEIRIDPESRRVWRGEEEIELTAIEFELLHTLARRPGRVFTREQLIEYAWKHAYYGVPKVVDVHIGHIRRKLERDPREPEYIVTVRGSGYRFEGPNR